MRKFLVGAFHLLFVLECSGAICVAQYDDIQTRTYVREAIAKGEILEALTYLETEAIAAEKANRWDKATLMYNEASLTARLNGQLQKGLDYARKGIEGAQTCKDPWLYSRAVVNMVLVLQLLGKHAEARDWILKGIENVQQIPIGGFREASSSEFHGLLGRDYLRTKEVEKAIEHLSYSVQVRESVISLSQRARAGQYVRANQDVLVRELQSLGRAYEIARMSDDAIRTYEKSLRIIKDNNLQSFRAGAIHANLGRLYLRTANYPKAEENLTKGFDAALKTQQSSLLVSTGRNLGNLFLQKDRPSEAINYFSKAIARIESSRAEIRSEEFRSSFFENQGEAYTGIIQAHLATNQADGAFNYNERARSRAFLDILGTKVQLSQTSSLG